MLLSPKYKILYDSALLLSINKHDVNGSIQSRVLLDDSDHTIETINYYYYTKRQVVKITNEIYNLRKGL